MDTKRIMLDILTAVAEIVENDPHRASGNGICNLVGVVMHNHHFTYEEKHVLWNYLDSLFLTWEHFSGELNYPVPANPGGWPRSTFVYASESRTMWADTPYGHRRRALLAHCIKRVSE